ncbi:hypothetical protein, partial [Kribbella antibiotica]|uniref:hypothetical protein n=1 Tax=Kribbella antibiotica TaxID=190195 RepID=UPI00192D5EB5
DYAAHYPTDHATDDTSDHSPHHATDHAGNDPRDYSGHHAGDNTGNLDNASDHTTHRRTDLSDQYAGADDLALPVGGCTDGGRRRHRRRFGR